VNLNEKTADNLAEHIAALLKGNGAQATDDLRSAIERLSQRLDMLEAGSSKSGSPVPTEGPKQVHPSLQRFKDLGEIADLILDRFNNQKECPYEPAGKPCDNCSMCSSRGF
jgi:cell division septation protein DedD